MTTSKSNRLDWVDIAKGITILLMVIGHTSIPEPISKYIWSFHMPFFFFVSGMFYSPNKYAKFKILLKRRVGTLIIPYIFFSVIVMLGYFKTIYWRPEELIFGWYGYALWFIPVLFVAELMLYPFAKYICRPITQYILIFALLLTSKLLAIEEIHLPFKLDAVPLACSFVFLGYILKDFSKKYQSPWWLITIAAIVSIILSQILPKTGIGRNEIGWVIPNYINALIGIFFIMQISRKLIEFNFLKHPKRFILWCGKNTLFILAFSQLFNYWILLSLNMIGCPHILGLPIRYVLLFISIYITSITLIRFTPLLVGKEKVS